MGLIKTFHTLFQEDKMKKISIMFIVLAAISFIGCSTIDVVLSKKVDVSKKMKKIAVFPFEITGASWGNEFSDSITHHFFITAKYIITPIAIASIIKTT